MQSIILIDTLYLLFYRFFATKKWFSLAKPKEYNIIKTSEYYDWSTNPIFMEKYTKMLLESIRKIIKKNIFEQSKIYFCMDSQKNIWRNKIHKTYKEGRVDLSLVNNFKPVFEITYRKIIPQIIKNQKLKFNLLSFDKMEADDIIATLCINLPKYIIYIVSNDDDYTQLGDKNIFYVMLNKNHPINITKAEAELRLKLKIIKGDKSDNIQPIWKDLNIPLKIRKLIMSDDKELIKFLLTNENAKRNYVFNKKMIDFKYIPKNLQKKVMTQFYK